MTTYDKTFFDYVNAGAVRSAESILPFLTRELELTSILDVGCGQGAWLSVWERLGITDLVGVDGDYVDRERFLASSARFAARNLEEPFDLQRTFDLVMSLEVAEHLPPASSAAFVADLTRHGRLVLFSAAPPGQGGHDHINEQPYEYWRQLFSARGYVVIDYLRPALLNLKQVEPWYRYNILLFAAEDRFASLPEKMRRCRIPDDQPVQDLSPVAYRLRKALVRLLPVPVMTRLARCKERLVARQH